MKLVGSITLATPEGDKQFAHGVDLGAAPSAQIVQGSLHQMLGAMANSLGIVQGSSLRALSVTVEGA